MAKQSSFFIRVPKTNVFVHLGLFMPSARFIITNSLSHTFEELRNIKRLPEEDNWLVFASCTTCHIAKKTALSIYDHVKMELRAGRITNSTALPGASGKFRMMKKCSGCGLIERCRTDYQPLAPAWPDAFLLGRAAR